MWIDGRTGKGWTDAEEIDFAEIMAAGGLGRMPAIRLWRRFRGNQKRALQYARELRGHRSKGDAGGKARTVKAITQARTVLGGGAIERNPEGKAQGPGRAAALRQAR